MKWVFGCIAYLCLSSIVCGQVDFELPNDNSVPVLTFDYSGGFRMRPPAGFVKKPRLQIFPDGRVLKSPNGPDLPSSEMKLTDEQFQKLLNRFVNELKFYEIRQDDIAEQIRKTGEKILIADATNVDVTMNLGKGRHSVSVYAVPFVHRQFPDIEPLANLSKIEKECQRLVAVCDLGGYEKLAAVIKSVNEKIKAENPKLKEVTEEKLLYVSVREQVTNVSFGDQYEVDGKGVSVRVDMTIHPDDEDQIKINVYPIKR